MRILLSVTALAALAGCGSDKDVDLKNASVEEVAAASQKAQKMEPGLWRSSVKIESLDIPGIPPSQKAMMEQAMAAQMAKASNIENCITKEQAEKPPAKMFGGDGDCTFEKYQLSGGRIDAKLNCTPPGAQGGKMEMTMAGSMSGTSYAIDSDMKMTGIPGMSGDGGMTMKMKVSGQRIGECKA